MHSSGTYPIDNIVKFVVHELLSVQQAENHACVHVLVCLFWSVFGARALSELSFFFRAEGGELDTAAVTHRGFSPVFAKNINHEQYTGKYEVAAAGGTQFRSHLSLHASESLHLTSSLYLAFTPAHTPSHHHATQS